MQADIFLLQQHRQPTQVLSHSQHLSDNQSHHGISGRSQAWHAIHQSQRGDPTTTPTRRNGTQTTTYTHPNWQQHSTWCHHEQHTTTMHQNNGHALPLALLPRNTGSIQILLAPQTYQLCWLQDKTPMCHTPHQKCLNILTPLFILEAHFELQPNKDWPHPEKAYSLYNSTIRHGKISMSTSLHTIRGNERVC